MANKLISQLTSGPILVTDLLEHEPLAGAPSLKGDVTALFSDASSVLVLDRDNRLLVAGAGGTSIDFENRLLIDSAAITGVNWESRFLYNSAGAVFLDFSTGTAGAFLDPLFIDQPNRSLIGSNTFPSIDWENREMADNAGNSSLNWESRQLIDSGFDVSIDWENRTLLASNGTTVVLDYSTQQPSSGPQTAGVLYTATEQTMIQEMYDALLAYGLLSP